MNLMARKYNSPEEKKSKKLEVLVDEFVTFHFFCLAQNFLVLSITESETSAFEMDN